MAPVEPLPVRHGAVTRDRQRNAKYDRQQLDQSDVKKPIDEVIFETQVWF